MAIELVPAPSRRFKTWSTRIVIATILFDFAVVVAKLLFDLHVMSAETLAAINTFLASAAGLAQFIKQQIKLTSEEKVEVIAAAAAQPVHPGEPDVAVQINGVPLPQAPAPGDAPSIPS